MVWRKVFAVVLTLGLISASAIAAPRSEVPAAPAPAVPAHSASTAQSPSPPASGPVLLEGKVLFHYREPALGVAPEERAREAGERLANWTQRRAVPVSEIQVVDDELASMVVAEGRVLSSVFDRDGAAEGVTRRALAERHAEAIRAAIELHNATFSYRSLLFGVIHAVVATVLLILVLVLFRNFFPRLYARLREWEGTRVRSVRIGSYELLGATRVIGTLVALARWFRILATVFLLYVWLLFVLGRFPWTRGISDTVIRLILDPLRAIGAAALAALPNLFFLAVIAIVTRYVIKLARLVFIEVEKGRIVLPGFYADWGIPTFRIVRFIILVFAVIVAFPYIPGSGSEAFKGVSIFLGVLFSLGSTSAISNIVAGLSIIYMRAFKIGDRVRIGDTVGDVTGMSLLVIHIRTIKDEYVTVPNAMVLNAHTVNYSARAKSGGLILHPSVTIGYDVPWRTVHELLIEAARRTENILREPKAFVLQNSLDDFYVTYELNAYTDVAREMVNTYSALHSNIQDAFNEAGVEIMSPHFSRLRDGNRTAIPDSYLPADYVPKSIRVETLSKEGIK